MSKSPKDAPTMAPIEAPSDELDRVSERETAAALRHLAVALVTALTCAAVTYAVPDLERFRPWIPGEPAPLTDLFSNWREASLPAWAGAGGSYGGEAQPDRTAGELGDTIAANLGGATPNAPPASATLRIDPSEYEGIEVTLVDHEHRGMAPFYEALIRTMDPEARAVTRVGHWGDSSIATDLITHTIRRNLQARFGDAGHGFILVAKGYMPYRHRDVVHRASDTWMLKEITRNVDSSGYYGYGGIQYRGRPGSWARFATDDRGPVGGAVSRYDIFYQRHRRGGDIRVRIDDEDPRLFSTRQPETEDAVERIEVPDGAHRLEVRFGGRGQPRIYGVAMEREGPGVVYDSLGIVGARANRLLNYDAGHIAGQIRLRGLDLVVLGFGGNEASDHIQRERYAQDYRRVIRRMRAGREELGCLVFAPLDQGERSERGRIVTMESIPDIVAGQRAAAAAEGCAFFDTWAAMGGEGAMRAWYRHRPRLAMGDFRHATPAGYEVIGNLFYKALLEGLADYLETRRPEAVLDAGAAPELAPATPAVEPDASADVGGEGAGDATAGDATAGDAASSSTLGAPTPR